MAVAETSRSSGKSGASGTTRSTRTKRKPCRGVKFQASNLHLAQSGIAQAAINSVAMAFHLASAQRDIRLATLQTAQTNNVEFDEGNFRRATSTAEVGTTIQTQGSLRMAAGNDINARAADVTAAKALEATAGNNIILDAGQSTTNVDQMARASGQDLLTTSSIRTRRQSSSATAQTSRFQGQSTSLVADNTLVSIGAKIEATGLAAGSGVLRIEGKVNTALYEVQNFSQSSKTTHTKTGLSAMLDPLGVGMSFADGEKTVTDSKASSRAIGTRLKSTQKIEVGVGAKTELRGAELEAPQIAFIQTDPNKTSELILGTSLNTTQTAHTEKTDTAGMWQEMKGNGQTVQTANQTQLKGNVNFDAALKITAQIPNTKGGQELKDQINLNPAVTPSP
jgi:hypothetical protein